MAGIYADLKSDFKIPPAGTHMARCIGMIEIGTVTTTFMDDEKILQKVSITWELPEELAVFNEEKGEQPFVVSKEYTLSMHEKSNLRKDLESWRGRGYTAEEAKHLDITSVLGQPCLLTIIHQPGRNDPSKMYPKIENVSKLVKGQVCPPQVNETKLLCYEDFDWELFSTLPDFMKDKIKQSKEFQEMQDPGIYDVEGKTPSEEDEPPF